MKYLHFVVNYQQQEEQEESLVVGLPVLCFLAAAAVLIQVIVFVHASGK